MPPGRPGNKMNKRQELNKAKLYCAFREMVEAENDSLYVVIIGELLKEDPTLADYFLETFCVGEAKKIVKRLFTDCLDNLEWNQRGLVAANIASDKCIAMRRTGKEPDRDALFEETLKGGAALYSYVKNVKLQEPL